MFPTTFRAAACAAILAATPLVAAEQATAAPIVFSGSGTAAGLGVSASATFEISGDTLMVALKNTSPSHDSRGQDVPASILTGVFFALPGNPVLTPVSATIIAGSIIQGGTCIPGPCDHLTTNVGGEFGYQRTGFPGNANQGIASSGYLTTGRQKNIGNFGGADLDGPESLGGINFGIVSSASGFNPNGGLEKVPLIQDMVTFTLTGVLGLSVFDISNVSFQYGAALSDPNIGGSCVSGCRAVDVPEPASLALLGAALAGLGLALRRRKGRA